MNVIYQKKVERVAELIHCPEHSIEDLLALGVCSDKHERYEKEAGQIIIDSIIQDSSGIYYFHDGEKNTHHRLERHQENWGVIDTIVRPNKYNRKEKIKSLIYFNKNYSPLNAKVEVKSRPTGFEKNQKDLILRFSTCPSLQTMIYAAANLVELHQINCVTLGDHVKKNIDSLYTMRGYLEVIGDGVLELVVKVAALLGITNQISLCSFFSTANLAQVMYIEVALDQIGVNPSPAS
jgi:hypothetical protein